MKFIFKSFLLTIAFLLPCPLLATEQSNQSSLKEPTENANEKSYIERPEFKALVEKLKGKPGLTEKRLKTLFGGVTQQKSILEAIARPAEKTKSWGEYRPIFITEKRINGGVEFWKKHQATLHKASQQFQVPPEIIVAIIGVETRYGKHAGRYRVLEALTTLGFDYPPRSAFFYKELEAFLLLEEYAGLDIENTKGSYAGAMGYGQFIPSSYRHYAVDFDEDGEIDIINNPIDAIGSVANYFNEHGWKPGEQVAGRAFLDPKTLDKKALQTMVDIDGLAPQFKIKDFKKAGLITSEYFDEREKASAYKLMGETGEEYWLCLNNFYVITRYNHSRLYAMSVFQLSKLIKMRKDFGAIN
jgi:membrane-bound lytic murein transglycosylase B